MRLSSKSQRFLQVNSYQLRAFILNRPIKQMTLAFQGSGNFEQFVKPLPHTKVENIAFAYIQNDLHTIDQFVSGSYGFGSLHIGNRGFKLFEDIDASRLIGLSLSDIKCCETDRLNLKVLVDLLQKTEIVKIDRLEVCWPVLQIILDNHSQFQNIKGFHIEFDPKFFALINRVADFYGPKLKYFSMVEAIVKYPKPKEYLTLVKLILSQSNHIKTLILTPFQHRAEWMYLLADLVPNLQELEELTISAVSQKDIDDSDQPVGAD